MVQKQASEGTEYCKFVYDENGNRTGVEYFRPVYDESGKQIGEEKIDKEAEKKQREEERKRIEEEEAKLLEEDNPLEEDIVVETAGTIGLTDSDNEAEEEAARLEEEKRKRFQEKLAAIKQMPDEEQKKAELVKLMKEKMTVTTTAETMTMTVE
jgi:hypothetical protein